MADITNIIEELRIRNAPIEMSQKEQAELVAAFDTFRAQLSEAQARLEKKSDLLSRALTHAVLVSHKYAEAVDVLRAVMDAWPIRNAQGGLAKGIGTKHPDGIAIKAAEDFLAKVDAAPVSPAAQDAGDWRIAASAWLKEKADKQAAINKANPRHVECYPEWEQAERALRWYASEVLTTSFVSPAAQVAPLCHHEAYQGRCIHCDAKFVGGHVELDAMLAAAQQQKEGKP